MEQRTLRKMRISLTKLAVCYRALVDQPIHLSSKTRARSSHSEILLFYILIGIDYDRPADLHPGVTGLRLWTAKLRGSELVPRCFRIVLLFFLQQFVGVNR